jgi:hypothetical protein
MAFRIPKAFMNPQQNSQARLEAALAELARDNADLRRENTALRERLGAASAGVRTAMRQCVNCKRTLPDGLSFYPGYLDEQSANSAAEARRHHCVYCR